MQVIRSPADAANIADPAIRQMILQRIDAIASDEPYDANLHGYFLVVEAGDTLQAINTQVGFDILCNRWTGLHYDHADYTPSFECFELIDGIGDLLIVIEDSGFAVELLFQVAEGIPPDLKEMCRRYAVPGTL